jgi:hypothetical protein
MCLILGHPSQPAIFGYSLELIAGSVPLAYFAMKQNIVGNQYTPYL